MHCCVLHHWLCLFNISSNPHSVPLRINCSMLCYSSFGNISAVNEQLWKVSGASSVTSSFASGTNSVPGEVIKTAAYSGDTSSKTTSDNDVIMSDARGGGAGGAESNPMDSSGGEDAAGSGVRPQDSRGNEKKNGGGEKRSSADRDSGVVKGRKRTKGPETSSSNVTENCQGNNSSSLGGDGEASGNRSTNSKKLKGDAAQNNEDKKSVGTGENANDNPPKNGGESFVNGDSESEKQKEGKASGSGEESSSQASGGEKSGETGGNGSAAPLAAAEVYTLLTGTLSYTEQGGVRRHAIRGNWQYSNSSDFPPLRFELLRNLTPDENLMDLPKDGEFLGSFSLQYRFQNQKGKMKTKSKVVAENGVNIKFTKKEAEQGVFSVEGKGTNQFGIFELSGTATKSTVEDDPTYNVKLRKEYTVSYPTPSPSEPAKEGAKKGKDKKKKILGASSSALSEGGGDTILPPPTQIHPSGILCLRGKLRRTTSGTLGLTDVTHKVSGVWANGLDNILDDPENAKGACNKFEYEHRSSLGSDTFPLSGRYTGWFYIDGDNQTKTRISERDITLKFRPNSEGNHNVDGKGSNPFGRYTLSGTLASDGTLTIFRHFLAAKQKKSATMKTSTPAPGPLNGSGEHKSLKPIKKSEPLSLSLEDVEIPDESEPVLMTKNPDQYSVVSRGILRINDDGAHTCSGKWANNSEQYANQQTSNFHFGLEAHHAAEDAELMLDRKRANGTVDTDDRQNAGKSLSDGKTDSTGPPITLSNTTFPIDSARYKGSFKMRRGTTTKYQSVVEKQIVLRFVKNSSGSYNVYGKGVNSIGTFNLVGTLILQGNGSGHVQLYRLYPKTALESEPAAPLAPPAPVAKHTGKVFSGSLTEKVSVDSGPVPAMDPPEKIPPSQSSLQRRESGRQVRAPSRLEDDDPAAQLSRAIEKCNQILKQLTEKDTGSFFSEPVDPVALGIPNYLQVITNPMDLGTIQTKMDANEIESPEEFARLVQLVFENAMKFNTLPNNVVHQAARNILVFFNQKYRDIERMLETTKKPRRPTKAEQKEARRREKEAKRKSKEDKDRKRKANDDSTRDVKRIRVEDFVAASKSALDAISDAAPLDPSASVQVTRTEFNLLLQMVQQMQEHVVAVHTLLSNSSSSKAAVASQNKAAPHENNVVTKDRPSTPPVPEAPRQTGQQKKKQQKKADKPKQEFQQERTSPPSPKPSPELVEDKKPLSFTEQEALSDAINRLPDRLLPGAMQIIRESSDFVNDDDDEIDLDIDQLDTVTQRKLQQFVKENVKPKRKKQTKKSRLNALQASAPTRAPAPELAAAPSHEPADSNPPKSKSSTKSFFAVGEGDDSDSDSDADADADVDADADADADDSGSKRQKQENKASLKSADSFLGDDDEDEEDDDDDIKDEFIATNWNLNPAKDAEEEGEVVGDSDDDEKTGDWKNAQKEAEASKAREADRVKREEKSRAEAEMAAQKRMAEAVALGEQARLKREEEEAAKARLREEHERKEEEDRKAAREKAMQEVKMVEPTFDLESQREIVKQYEQEFNDSYSAGASPSSDFGF